VRKRNRTVDAEDRALVGLEALVSLYGACMCVCVCVCVSLPSPASEQAWMPPAVLPVARASCAMNFAQPISSTSYPKHNPRISGTSYPQRLCSAAIYAGPEKIHAHEHQPLPPPSKHSPARLFSISSPATHHRSEIAPRRLARTCSQACEPQKTMKPCYVVLVSLIRACDWGEWV
jgi:hypothetical protein